MERRENESGQQAREEVKGEMRGRREIEERKGWKGEEREGGDKEGDGEKGREGWRTRKRADSRWGWRRWEGSGQGEELGKGKKLKGESTDSCSDVFLFDIFACGFGWKLLAFTLPTSHFINSFDPLTPTFNFTCHSTICFEG